MSRRPARPGLAPHARRAPLLFGQAGPRRRRHAAGVAPGRGPRLPGERKGEPSRRGLRCWRLCRHGGDQGAVPGRPRHLCRCAPLASHRGGRHGRRQPGDPRQGHGAGGADPLGVSRLDELTGRPVAVDERGGRSRAIRRSGRPTISEQLLVRGKGRLLLVDPLSVSGALAPRVALAAERISVPESRVALHPLAHSARWRCSGSDTSGDTVAFVWNGALAGTRMQGLRTVEIPALARMRIPPDALIVRSDLPQLAQLKGALNGPAANRAGPSFHADPAWREGTRRCATGWPRRVADLPTGSRGWTSTSLARCWCITRTRSRRRCGSPSSSLAAVPSARTRSAP